MNISEYSKFIESKMIDYFPDEKCYQKDVIKAMKYSVLNGGKRLRPILLLEFCKLCGGNIETAIPFACAIEMIHTYSLIHDDLPSMDNDDFRRGKPSCHIAFGEDIAILAGDALLNLAFEIMSDKQNLKNIDSEVALKIINVISSASGSSGMIGGQVIDLKMEGTNVDIELIESMYEKKTGAIIIASVYAGCLIAKASQEKIDAAIKYAKNIGLSFQIVDDILDLTSDSKTLGKPTGSDLKNKKSTYVSIMGLEKSKILVKNLTNQAIECLNSFNGNVTFLKDLALSLENRKN